jgi:hypothetical protein
MDVITGRLKGRLPTLLDDDYWQTRCFDSLKTSSEFHLKTHWKMVRRKLFLIGGVTCKLCPVLHSILAPDRR